MMSTLWTVAAVCLCLGGHPRSETSELKKQSYECKTCIM